MPDVAPISRTNHHRFLRQFLILIFFSLSFQLLLHHPHAYANNVTIENVVLVDQDTQDDTIEIQFDISWENAYSDLTGDDAVVDAVWVIAKIQNTFTHLTLDVPGLNPAEFQRGTAQAGSAFDLLDIVVSDDRTGAWIQPGDVATGTMDFHAVSLVWSYAEDGYTDANADDQNVELIGIEMVYIHESGFDVGDAAGTSTGFEMGSGGGTDARVDSEGVIRFRSDSADHWYYRSGGNVNEDSTGASFDLPGGFPKGYQGFYMMKHEISYGLWNQYETVLTGAGDTNHSEGSGNDDYEAVTDIHWYDLAGFCDFAALRPMTELEFEKAARGKGERFQDEYAWGGATGTAHPLIECDTLTGSTSTETCTTTSGNASINVTTGVLHPTRVGMYATTGVTARKDAGASYYGILDLTGNVAEMVVSVGHEVGRAYQGTHGDGILVNGNATNMDWPGSDPGTPSTGVDDGNGLWGVGHRGGSWNSAISDGEMSDRAYATDSTQVQTTQDDVGGRCVRTAPRVMVDYFESEKA